MTTEKKRLFSIVTWSTFFIIPLWSLALWAFNAEDYLAPYWIIAGIGATMSFVFLLRKEYLLWYFLAGTISALSSIIVGLAFITGALLIMAFSENVSPNTIMIITFVIYAIYSVFPLKYYYNDYHRTENDRMKSFDFENGTYDIKSQSIVRGDAFADFYTKSFLAKAHYGVIRLHLIFPISGGAIAIIAGNISKNLQLGIGIVAVILTSVLFIQIFSLGFFNAWQVRQLEKRYGKRIRILWGDEKE